jgi:hypothetical protein
MGITCKLTRRRGGNRRELRDMGEILGLVIAVYFGIFLAGN